MLQPDWPRPESRSRPSASLSLILVAPALLRQGSHEDWASWLADDEEGVELDMNRAKA